jgi:hypothetical protein
MNTWMKGLLAAALGGAVGTLSEVMTGTGTLNRQTAVAAGVGALIAVVGYLKQSPLK